MPQEELTWKFFRNGARSKKIEWKHDFAEIIKRWMQESGAYANDYKAFVDAKHEEDPTLLIKELVALGNEVARADLNPLSFPPDNAVLLQ